MTFEVKFSERNREFAPTFKENKNDFRATFKQVQAVTDYTKGKLMIDDVVIKKVPVYRVSNTSGGTTIYIAREV